ncbi:MULTISPECIES: hypothetical protein [Burkholderiaceae]|uniref:hypothetical protein n=1 Tax=Burkholderiaceae TaxID=119060 RepID=UPI000DB23DFD|nr:MULTISPECIES: hypothetical protein [Burkholderiaceae]PZR46013.1 MAG: hypothetical protein DI523_18860 [Paraburkholderia fungorum]
MKALVARVLWAQSTIADESAATGPDGDESDLARAAELVYQTGFDAYPDLLMPELIRGAPLLASRRQKGFADARCAEAIYRAGLG